MQRGKLGPYNYINIKLEEIEQDVLRAEDDILVSMMEKLREGDTDAIEYIGLAYLYGSNGLDADFSKAFSILQLAAQGGSIISQHYLADCYAYGIGMPEDLEAARNYYRLSAQSQIPKNRDAALEQLKRLETKV
ncbi:MAG: hypothetical protein LUE11_06520 [Clostridia bacterium]|nr:hypothetical protein [Clostridia bacterium]